MPATDRNPPVNMDLLRLFDRVAALGSIAAAARELDLSPSLATRRVAALESSLRTRLFQRTTRSIKLTEGGAIALQWARGALGSYAEVADDLAAVEGRPSGQVRVALSEYAALQFLPGFLGEFAPRYPEIRFDFTTTDSVVKLVEEGYDVAVHSGLIPDASFVGVRLRDVQRVLCAAPAYLERRGAPRRLEDLAAHHCLVHAPTEVKNWFFRRGRRLTGQPVNPYILADDYLVLIELARQGLGIIRISRNAVREDLRSGRLVQVLPEYQCVYSTGELPGIWVIYPNRRLLYRTRVFVDALTAYLEKALSVG
jgi:LysR family transcriptional regulator, transcriptional activator for dmlA